MRKYTPKITFTTAHILSIIPITNRKPVSIISSRLIIT